LEINCVNMFKQKTYWLRANAKSLYPHLNFLDPEAWADFKGLFHI
jgi:hypothetical protein